MPNRVPKVVLTLLPEEVMELEKEKPRLSPTQTPVAYRLVDEAIRQARRRYLSPRQVAEMFDVTERTVRKWCEQGKIIAFQPSGPGGEWRIPADQFAATPEQIRAFRQTAQEIAAKYGEDIDDFEQ